MTSRRARKKIKWRKKVMEQVKATVLRVVLLKQTQMQIIQVKKMKNKRSAVAFTSHNITRETGLSFIVYTTKFIEP